MKTLNALVLLGMALSVLQASAQPAVNPEVRVWLTRWRSSPVQVSTEGRWWLSSASEKREMPPATTLFAEIAGDEVSLMLQRKRLKAKEWTIEAEFPVSLAERRGNNRLSYRGKIILRVHKSMLQVINVLPLEEYLSGVVPLEMPLGFPPEALKAQAVAARSWTVRNRGKHEMDGADVCDSTHCQLYGGVSAERDIATAAVKSTAGLVMVNGDIPLDGVYTADCGGVPAGVGASNSPQPDRNPNGEDYCAANPQHRWSLNFTFSEVWQAVAGKDSLNCFTNNQIDVQIDASGRLLSLLIRCGDNVRLVSGTRLRSVLRLPSTLCTVRLQQGSTVVIEGSGSGHGNGLCQWGAAGRARAGQTMEQILQAYYPGARIAPLSEAIWNWRNHRKRNLVP